MKFYQYMVDNYRYIHILNSVTYSIINDNINCHTLPLVLFHIFLCEMTQEVH